MTYENLFYIGEYNEIIQNYQQGTGGPKPAHELIFVLGAYCFLSETEKAEGLLPKIAKSFLPMAHFFLSVCYTRNSFYKKAEAILLTSLKNSKNLEPHDLFFYYQGFGFYRYFGARFKKAEMWASLAKKSIDKKTSTYFHLVCLDLVSHILVKRGHIHLGLKTAEQALTKAKLIKSISSEEAILVSSAIYESQYINNPEETLNKLESLINLFKSKNSYYHINLVLEYVRRLNLNGELDKSAEWLQQIKDTVFTSSMNRQKAMWSFKFSHLCYLRNQIDQALNFAEAALSYLDANIDLVLQVQILGLKYKISKRRNLDVNSLENEIKRITFLTQESTALSYAYRYGWIKKPNTEDAYSYFFHRWLKEGHKDFSTLQGVLKKGWHSLLVDLLPEHRKNFIYLDVLPKKGILFFENKIILKDGLTPLLRQTLLLLRQGPITKERFVELIWGYQYDSYRHDPLIYTVVNRLKDFLKPFSDTVYIQDQQIFFIQTDVRVYDHLSVKPESLSLSSPSATEVGLNQRQYELLEYLKSHKSITVTSACQYLHVSKITACRDLSSLLKQELIIKRGQARATTYSLRG